MKIDIIVMISTKYNIKMNIYYQVVPNIASIHFLFNLEIESFFYHVILYYKVKELFIFVKWEMNI